jgi:flagellar assembly protein FliH
LSNKIIPREALNEVHKLDLGDLGQVGTRATRVRADSAPSAEAPDPQMLARVREAAYREGIEIGRREAQSTNESERAELKALIAGMQELIRDFEQTLADEVLAMSLELAKQIVRQSLRIKPDLVVAVVREAVSSLAGLTEQTVLALNPADAVLVSKSLDSDTTLATLPWKIVEDAQIERGGCRLETASTEVDAGLETRWRRVLAALGRDDAWIDIAT